MTGSDAKTFTRRRIIKGAGALAAGIAAPSILRVRSALAAYPDRPVRIVVANTPGGPSDITARILAAALQEATGGSFIVENKGGAGGNLGMGFAARAEPDGYTLILITNAFSVNPGLYNQIPYDPFKDFAVVCDIATSPNTFVVKSDLNVTTVKDFVSSPRPIRRSSTWRRRRSAPRRNCSRNCSSCAKGCKAWPGSCSPAAATPSRACSRTPCSSPQARCRRPRRISRPAR